VPWTARSVPEGCGRLVWRRAGPSESHAHGSYEPNEPNEPSDPNEPNDPNDPNESDESGQ
jgi:hypothetical protein